MRHLDLFSGIGGFALAAQWAYGEAHEIVSFCEIDPFAQQVLKKNFPNAPVSNDIKELRGDSLGKIDIVTGGFPCQPFSVAGKRRGTEDNRFLWPEMFRVIKECEATWVIAENVRGFISNEGGLVFEQACLDLESIGYEIQTFIIPACAVNAPHKRDRMWIIANKHGSGKATRSWGGDRDASNTTGGDDGRHFRESEERQIQQSRNGIEQGATTDPDVGGIRRHERESVKEIPIACSGAPWKRQWVEVATELCGMDDGLPAELDGLKFTKAGHRKERLKSLGNAIVPQIAYQIFNSIKQSC